MNAAQDAYIAAASAAAARELDNYEADSDSTEQTCEWCSATYPDAGDGWDGLCPTCADRAELIGRFA
jgi:hypothetical protein